MATQIEGRLEVLYRDDLGAWARQQAELLRDRRFADLDLEHLIEEVEGLGESEFRSVRSRVRTIVEHLLKLEHSPAADPRPGWRETVRTQRADLDEGLSPSLRVRLEAAMPPPPFPRSAPTPSSGSPVMGCQKRCYSRVRRAYGCSLEERLET